MYTFFSNKYIDKIMNSLEGSLSGNDITFLPRNINNSPSAETSLYDIQNSDKEIGFAEALDATEVLNNMSGGAIGANELIPVEFLPEEALKILQKNWHGQKINKFADIMPQLGGMAQKIKNNYSHTKSLYLALKKINNHN